MRDELTKNKSWSKVSYKGFIRGEDSKRREEDQ